MEERHIHFSQRLFFWKVHKHFAYDLPLLKQWFVGDAYRLNIDILQGSVATCLRCDGDISEWLLCKFTSEPVSERILKIGQHLMKRRARAVACFWLTAVYNKLEMWANAQRDGRPAEYRWRPLFNAAKFGWRPLLQCCAVTLPSRETSWNLQGCPKLPDRSQLLVGGSSPYCEDMWRRYCCLTRFFFRLSTCASVAKI